MNATKFFKKNEIFHIKRKNTCFSRQRGNILNYLYAQKAVRLGGLYIVCFIMYFSATLFLFRSATTIYVYLPMNVIRMSVYCLSAWGMPTFVFASHQTNNNEDTCKIFRCRFCVSVPLSRYAAVSAAVSSYAVCRKICKVYRTYESDRLSFELS